ncbi:MAG: hypothetical protein JOZ18_08990 [Chloroflexi bacterium]|nr:hypothetical protein [Chloroflexota bacterium]
MEAEEILAQTRGGGQPPEGWIVFPLLRHKVILAIVGWTSGILMGLGLLIAIGSVVIPYNYERGTASIVFTTILLGILLFIALGSAYLLIMDVLRLRNLDKHVIVITPENFVKQEGDKIILVPLTHVRHVTARGVPPPDRTPPPESESGVRGLPGMGENALGFFLGRAPTSSGSRGRRKRMRTPTSLAFIDSRTDQEVTVVNDTTYGDPFAIAALLKQYAASVREFIL